MTQGPNGTPRKYFALIVPVGFVVWRLWSLGPTSLDTLRNLPTRTSAAQFKTAIMWEMWAAVLVLLVVMVVFEREPAASIGIRKPNAWDLAWVPAILIASLVLEIVWAMAFVELSGHSLSDLPHVRQSIDFPIRLRLFMFVTESVFEETVFRGYLIERLQSLTGSVAATVGISAVGSSLMHGGWTLGLFIIPLGLSSAMLYAWRRNLPACLLLHALWMLTPLMGVA